MDGDGAVKLLRKAVERLLPKVLDHSKNFHGKKEAVEGLFQAMNALLRNRWGPQHMDRTNEAGRFRVLEGLLRNYLKFVKYPTTQPPAHPSASVGALGVQRSLLGRYLAAALEADGDVIAAILIRAALNVAESAADGHDTAIVDEFLQLAIGRLVDDQSKGASFLYTVLGDLMQKEAEGDGNLDPVRPDSSGGVSPDFSLTVLIGNELIPVPFYEILPFFWAPHGQVTTYCHACALPFVGEPPIRTIHILMSDVRILGVRVFNRHFSCLKANRIPFVPVSHVWTDPIREANATRAHNNAATTKLIGTLVGLGMGAKSAYGPEVEFWHDYFSVPQWQPEVKEQLLVRLPAIYHLADEILVHLEDLCPSSLVSLFMGGFPKLAGTSNDPLLEVMRVVPHIRNFLGSEWMRRMWVMLEFAQCRAACVMMKWNIINRVRDDATQKPTMGAIYERDSFSHALTLALNHLPNLFRYARSIAMRASDSIKFIGGLGTRHLPARGPPSRLFLGEAMELVASRQCQYSRDRFVALDVLLDGQRTAWLPAGEAVLPAPAAEACAHVWLKALRRGDYSPLLLQPRERIPGSNPSTQPSWMVGRSGLEGVEWHCGSEEAPPDLVPVITDEGIIRVTLALAGEIEQICYLDVGISGKVAGVAFGLHLVYDVAKAEAVEMSPELLIDGLSRIFPLEHTLQGTAQENDRMFSFADLKRRDPAFANRIRGLLKEYEEAGDGSSLAQVAQSISDALGLEKDIVGLSNLNFTCLTGSKYMASWREVRGAKGGDPICKVRCPECRRVTLFRLDLRETGGVGQQVYRIPGLAYTGSSMDGVGLVIDKEGRITGRMFHGPPACHCRLMVEVEIH
jgi:hypothetical protein